MKIIFLNFFLHFTEDKTADQCLAETFEMFQKHYGSGFPGKDASDFVFKAAGIREFICGPTHFSSFEYIRKKISKQEKIELVLFERNSIITSQENKNETFDQEWMQGGEEVSQKQILLIIILNLLLKKIDFRCM